MPRGWVACEAGARTEYLYFPISCIVSVLSLMEDGACPEVAVIGNDGVVGIAMLLGGAGAANTRGVVQSAGHGYRIPVSVLKLAMEEEAPLRDLLMRFVLALATQMGQSAACNRFHEVDQQVCRLLLTSLDRWTSNRLSLTHERMSILLGVRRETVSGASKSLASEGLISYVRGCVTVLDRAGLEERACECYGAVKTEMDRLLPKRAPPTLALVR
jgi:CRP-like cAMP-binding protein